MSPTMHRHEKWKPPAHLDHAGWCLEDGAPLENGDVLLNDEFITDGLLEMPIVKITYNKCH